MHCSGAWFRFGAGLKRNRHSALDVFTIRNMRWDRQLRSTTESGTGKGTSRIVDVRGTAAEIS